VLIQIVRISDRIIRTHRNGVKGKTGVQPTIFPMTTALPKALLLTTFQEYDTAQQRAGTARSKMHCIIAALPDEGKPVGTPSASCDVESTVAHSQNDGDCAKQPLRPLFEKEYNPKNRPFVTGTAPQSVIADSKPLPKSVPKRMSPQEKKARTQEALIYLAANSHLTQEQAAIYHGLEEKALSRPYAKKIKKSMSPNRDKTPKDIADDFLYNEKRQKQK
jgi:hypothetical protein